MNLKEKLFLILFPFLYYGLIVFLYGLIILINPNATDIDAGPVTGLAEFVFNSAGYMILLLLIPYEIIHEYVRTQYVFIELLILFPIIFLSGAVILYIFKRFTKRY